MPANNCAEECRARRCQCRENDIKRLLAFCLGVYIFVPGENASDSDNCKKYSLYLSLAGLLALESSTSRNPYFDEIGGRISSPFHHLNYYWSDFFILLLLLLLVE